MYTAFTLLFLLIYPPPQTPTDPYTSIDSLNLNTPFPFNNPSTPLGSLNIPDDDDNDENALSNDGTPSSAPCLSLPTSSPDRSRML